MKRSVLVAVAALACIGVVAGAVLGDGNLALALGAPLAVGAALALWKIPLRIPLLVLAFLALVLENPADVPAQGMWRSPLATFGALMLAHLNVTLPHKWLFFSGLDLILAYAISVDLLRAPTERRSPAARPLATCAIASLAAAAGLSLYGWLRGDADLASGLWQVQRVAYLPVVFLAFQRTLRPRDGRALATVLIVAAGLKACIAIWIRHSVPPPAGEPALQYATTHADSMLFAGGACVLVVTMLERRLRALELGALALLIAGMIANTRRIAWVELAAGLLVVFALTPRTRTKRHVVQAAALGSPVALLYVAIGWGSGASLFAPVHTLRSVVDSSADASTTWRDWENYDLFFTIRSSPLLGVGYGHGYIEKVPLPDISSAYGLYRFIPHNSILGLWAYGGIVGFTALWTMLVAGVFFGARAHRFARTRGDRIAALSTLAMLVVYSVHCYGDMGLGTWTGVFTVAPALALAAQLAVATGAWPDPRRNAGGDAEPSASALPARSRAKISIQIVRTPEETS